jgi:hypothetical protein
MATIKQWLQGNKTYLGMICLGVLGILWSQGIVSDKTAEIIGPILAGLTGIAFKAGVNRTEAKVDALVKKVDR